MICYVCDEKNWKLFPELNPERTLSVCQSCGNVAYQIEPEEEAKIKNYYLKEYRGAIVTDNILTTTRKLNYLKKFIDPWLEQQEKAGKKLTCGEVGCATGYFVAYLRSRGHRATGSEWTINMRRFAEHYYGVPVTEELELKHKYDLITMYHVFEHLIEPDKKLARYRDMLSDDGLMLIATPEWLDVLEEGGGADTESFTHLFHKDHINVFTKTSIQNVFRKSGLVILKTNFLTYGQAYLLRKSKPGEVIQPIVRENPDEIEKKILACKNALDTIREAKKPNADPDLYRKALQFWPKFPEAYYHWIYNTHVKKDLGRAQELWREAFSIIPENVRLKMGYAMWLYQQERFEEALKEYDWVLSWKPAENVMFFKALCLFQLGRYTESMAYFNATCTMNPTKWQECQMWMCKAATNMEAWDERAAREMKETLFKQAAPVLAPEDPMFKEPNQAPAA